MVLVRAGARIAYINKNGQVRNAVELAERYPYIVRFLLVRRYGQLAIGNDAFWAAEYEIGEGDGDRPKENEDGGSSTPGRPETRRGDRIPIRPWSGITEAPFLMTGTRKDHRQMNDESSLEYAKRLAGVRMSLRGRTITPYAGPRAVGSGGPVVSAAVPAKADTSAT